MKIRVEHIDCEENEIVLRCPCLDEEMLEILSLLKERIMKIAAFKEEETFMVTPSDVMYVESVDGKTFIYTSDAVMETKEALADLEIKYSSTGMVRISKSTLVNLYQVKSMKSLINSRIEITIESGEKLIVSRHYISVLKNRLEID